MSTGDKSPSDFRDPKRRLNKRIRARIRSGGLEALQARKAKRGVKDEDASEAGTRTWYRASSSGNVATMPGQKTTSKAPAAAPAPDLFEGYLEETKKFVDEMAHRLEQSIRQGAFNEAMYLQCAEDFLNYIVAHTEFLTGADRSSVKITASLMYFNPQNRTLEDIEHTFGAEYKHRPISATLEIQSFCSKHTWDQPYIRVPMFKEGPQILGAPTALETKNMEIIQNTLQLPQGTSNTLKAYFEDKAKILKTFVSIPLRNKFTKENLGVLNINADRANFFKTHIYEIQRIVEPVESTLCHLLNNRPSHMEQSPKIPDEHDSPTTRTIKYLKEYTDKERRIIKETLSKAKSGLKKPPKGSPSLLEEKSLKPEKIREIQKHLNLFKIIFGYAEVEQAMAQNQGELTPALIEKFFMESPLKFYVTTTKEFRYTYLLTQDTGGFERYSPFQPLSPWEAIEKFPIAKLEEAMERGISTLEANQQAN